MSVYTTSPDERERHRNALYLQGRIIGALMVRELHTRFGKHHLGLIWLLIEPLCYAAVYTYLRQYLGRVAPIGTSLEVFIFTGLMPYFLVRNLSVKVMRVLDVEDTTRVQPIVTYIDVVGARAMLEITLFMAAVIVWMTFLGVMGFQWYPDDPMEFVFAFGALVLLGTGGGILNAVVANYISFWPRVVPWILRIALFTSGAIFVVYHFAPDILYWLKWNPMFHGVEWVRSAFYGEFHSQHLDKVYLLMHGGLLLLVGLLLERTLKRKPVYE